MWFEERLRDNQLLVIPGAYDALSARCLQAAGFESVYLGSYAIAASSLGAPDLGILSFGEVLEVYRRIGEATDVPLVVDADTGYGGPHNVARTVRQLGQAGAAAIQIEDQVTPKRCGHLAGKDVVALGDAVGRIEAAVEAAEQVGIGVIARTDALAPLGLDAAIERCRRFTSAGASAVFVDAVTSVDQLKEIRQRVDGPLVFNGADTGLSPDISTGDVHQLGLSVFLLPVQILFAAWHAVSARATELARHPGDVHVPSTQGHDFHSLNTFLGLPDMLRWESRLGSGTKPAEHDPTARPGLPGPVSI